MAMECEKASIHGSNNGLLFLHMVWLLLFLHKYYCLENSYYASHHMYVQYTPNYVTCPNLREE